MLRKRHHFALWTPLLVAAASLVWLFWPQPTVSPKLIGPKPGSPAIILATGDLACDPDDPRFNNEEGIEGACQQKAVADAMAHCCPPSINAE